MIRSFCSAAVFTAAILQVMLNLAEPTIFLLATLAGISALTLPWLGRALWHTNETRSNRVG